MITDLSALLSSFPFCISSHQYLSFCFYLFIYLFFLPASFSFGIWYCSIPQLQGAFAWKTLDWIYIMKRALKYVLKMGSLKTAELYSFFFCFFPSFSFYLRESREPGVNTHFACQYIMFQTKDLAVFGLLYERDLETWLPHWRKIISVQFKLKLQFSDVYIISWRLRTRLMLSLLSKAIVPGKEAGLMFWLYFFFCFNIPLLKLTF